MAPLKQGSFSNWLLAFRAPKKPRGASGRYTCVVAVKAARRAASKERVSATAKRSPWKRRVKLAVSFLFIALTVSFLYFGFRFYRELEWAAGIVPNLDEEISKISTNPSVIVSADGKTLYRVQTEYRKPADFGDIPQIVRDATLAAEDHRFYDHSGVDWLGLARAAFVNAKEGRSAQGASTITMQLAKRLYTGTQRTFDRKLKDMALAVQIERYSTKDQILTTYLNQVYYGSGAYGVRAAADVYFGKSLDELSLGEAAMLARMVRRPSHDNPFDDLDRAIRNRNLVLQRMLEYGMIAQDQYEAASQEEVKLAPRRFGSGARTLAASYFTDWVLETLKKEFPDLDITKGGYRIETTLDLELQEYAEKQVAEVIEKFRKQKLTTGAFVLLNDSGQVLAMVGGADYDRNQFNVITHGVRQPGSSFKPFVYATALSSGVIDTHSRISNEPLSIEDPVKGRVTWPKNANGKYGGEVSVRTALASSINVPAARVCIDVGPQTVSNFARDVFGIRSPMAPVPSLALGSSGLSLMEMAEGYSVFMLKGDRLRPYGIVRIVGPEGEVVRSYSPKFQRGVLDRRVAEAMDGFLRAVITGGTGTRARTVENARGKTGTTSDHRDAWFCGYTNSLLGIGWVASEKRVNGRWEYDPMSRVFGGQVTIQIWEGVMKEAVKKYKAREDVLPGPSSIPASADPDPDPDEPPVDDAAGHGEDPLAALPENPAAGDTAAPLPGTSERATDAVPSPIVPGQSESGPTGERNAIRLEICVDSGLIANRYCPETVRRRFDRGAEPRNVCPLHGPHP